MADHDPEAQRIALLDAQARVRLTHAQLAREAWLGLRTVGKAFAGERVSRATGERLASALSTTAADLFPYLPPADPLLRTHPVERIRHQRRLSIPSMARELGVSRDTYQRYIRRGKLPKRAETRRKFLLGAGLSMEPHVQAACWPELEGRFPPHLELEPETEPKEDPQLPAALGYPTGEGR